METRKELSKIYAINCGGCGIAALIMYRELKEKHKLTKTTAFVYVFKSYCFNDKEINERTLNGEGNEYKSPSHMLLYHRGRYYDSNRVYKCIKDYTDEPVRTLFIKDEEFVVKNINIKREWNSTFRRKSVSHLKQYLKGVKL